MKLIIISGRSGSGKTTALQVLEDLGYYCIDNLPASLLPSFGDRIRQEQVTRQNQVTDLDKVAVSIDARNISADLQSFPHIASTLSDNNLEPEIIYLDANSDMLLSRYSENRRKHPLSDGVIGLSEAIEKERALLEPIASMANLSIDTTNMSMQQLRDHIKQRVADKSEQGLALLFQSFGFKNGVPVDADIVYDVRCLPNPYWKTSLRSLTGRDQEVADFLQSQQEVEEMFEDICQFLTRWLPRFEDNNRSYFTIAVGCTGGQHRSVYLCERLSKHFSNSYENVQIRHKELS